MLTTSTHPICRLARPEDDLSPLLGNANDTFWNRECILVAEVDGQLVGMVILWDCGHGVLICDHLVCTHNQAGAALILAVNQYCQDHGIDWIRLHTTNIELAYHGKRRGAHVSAPMMNVLYRVTERTGASHG